MSASQDSSQKITFVYTNLYSLYKKGKEAAISSNPFGIPAADKARVIRAGSLQPGLRIKSWHPTSFDDPVQTHHPRSKEVQNLKASLNSLKNLQSRLHFMLTELEDLSKTKKD